MRELNVQDELGELQRDLHFRQDGSWTSNEATAVLARAAELEVFLWAVHKRKSLRPIEDLNKVIVIPLPKANEITSAESFIWRDVGDFRLALYDLLPALLRMAVELEARHIHVPQVVESELLEDTKTLRRSSEKQSIDLVLGMELVTECADQDLTHCLRTNYFARGNAPKHYRRA